MTDLLSRPLTPRSARSSTGGSGEGRALSVSAALASLAAAGATLVTCLAVAVVGWFLADAGAHGSTTDALRVGADLWLVGHGSGLTVSGAPLGLVPLALTGAFAVVAYRLGRWAARTSAPPDGDRALGVAATVFTGLYVVVAVVTFVLVGTDGAAPGLGRTIVSSLLLAGAAGTLGMAGATGRLRTWTGRVPGWALAVGRGAVASVLLLVAAASLLVATMMVLHLNDAATVMSGLHLGAGDYVVLTLACATIAPNAVLLGAAYLLGPGFAVGVGTTVSPSAVVLGPVPAVPLLAALPGAGPTPGWAMGLLAVPVLAAAVGAGLAQRVYRVTAYDSAALRGFGSGFAAALVTTMAVALAGGPMGTGRLAEIGAPAGEVLVAAVAAMSIGGLLGGLLTAWRQRRR